MSHLADYDAPTESSVWYAKLKKGDILYFPANQAIHIVCQADGTSNIYTRRAEYSLGSKPGTWSLYGDKVVYTPGEEDQGEENFGDLTNSDYPITPLSCQYNDKEKPAVNPCGIFIRRNVFDDRCPWNDCGDGLFYANLPRMRSVFPSLTCKDILACPICYGWEFAKEDKDIMQDIFTTIRRDGIIVSKYSLRERSRRWWHRWNSIYRRRQQLGLPLEPYI